MSDRSAPPRDTKKDGEQPKSVPESSAVSPEAPQAIQEMDRANRQGASRALAQIDGDNPPLIESGLGRRHGGKDRGEAVEPPMRTVPHPVRAGQTLWSIGQEHGSDNANTATPQQIHDSIGQILEANPRLQNPDRLRPGEVINIPETARTGIRQEGRQIAGAPAALVLDSFNENATERGVANISHGGFLSAGFSAMGFNVFRGNAIVNPVSGGGQSGRADFTPVMERAANFIAANRDRFPAGSFVNTSFGNMPHDPSRPERTGDLTYRGLARMIGVEVKPGSVAAQRDEILRRLEHVAAGRNPETGQPDPSISVGNQRLADAAVRTNQQINRIQGMGVEVVHSAGNDGPQRIDINFLRATQIRSDGSNGQPLKFSGIGSHTEHGAGIFQFHMVDRKNVVADVNGFMVSAPITTGARFDRRDHRVDESKLSTAREFRPIGRGELPPQFNTEARERGYAQRVYNLGPVVDFAPGTSFAPLTYIFNSRNIQRPPEP